MEAKRPSLAKRLRIDAHAAWLAARDPRCPWYARAWGLFVTAYALSPIDLIPDFIPVLGLLDDALLIPFGLWLFVRMIPPGLIEEHRAAAAAAAERPVSRAGVALVIAAWAAAALIVALLVL
ncbi:MAG TPA: YkvA family protein [Allosphingosinicella sp.]|jgi:uncharacterized membrane protein YkvA (DUF1232 family)